MLRCIIEHRYVQLVPYFPYLCHIPETVPTIVNHLFCSTPSHFLRITLCFLRLPSSTGCWSSELNNRERRQYPRWRQHLLVWSAAFFERMGLFSVCPKGAPAIPCPLSSSMDTGYYSRSGCIITSCNLSAFALE